MSQNINLYDASLRPSRAPLTLGLVTSVAAGVLVVCAAIGLLLGRDADVLQARAQSLAQRVKTGQDAVQALDKEIKGATPDARLLAQLAAAQTGLERRRALLSAMQAGGLGEDRGYSTVLTALARQAMPGVWLVGIGVEHRDIALRGRASSADLLPGYIGRLEQEQALRGRSFRALQIQRPAEAAQPGPQTVAAAGTSSVRPAYVDFALIGAEGKAAAGIGQEGAR